MLYFFRIPLLVMLFTSSFIFSAKAQVKLTEEKLNWWEDPDGFLNQQAKHSLDLVTKILTKHKPQTKEPDERRQALLLLDNVLHEPNAAKRPNVQHFFHQRIGQAAQNIAQTKVRKGAVIWKLYNHGFVVKTATVTIAFDLVRAYSAKAEGFALPDSIMNKIISECDALFISHFHGDHADEWVAQQFINSSKPVITPPGVWENKPIYNHIQHLERNPEVVHTLPLQNKASLKIVILPGHQGKNILNNIPLVTTPEGMTFSQTGDQSNLEDLTWIDQIKGKWPVDVVLPNCWTTDITRLVKGFNPKLVITGHENEMGHSIDHREPYWLTYVRLQKSDYPRLLMTWGESYHYKP